MQADTHTLFENPLGKPLEAKLLKELLICMIWLMLPGGSRTSSTPDLYDLAHVAGWEQYIPHDLGHASWVGLVLYRACTTSHSGRLGSKRSRSWPVRRVMPQTRANPSLEDAAEMQSTSTSTNASSGGICAR